MGREMKRQRLRFEAILVVESESRSNDLFGLC